MSWFRNLFKGPNKEVVVNPPQDEEEPSQVDTAEPFAPRPYDDTESAPVVIDYDRSAVDIIVDPPAFPELVEPEDEEEDPGEPVAEDPRFANIKPLDLMKVKFQPAANQSRRRDEVRGICLHHIMMGSFKKNVDFLASKESGVSAHYCLGRNAELAQMVNTTKKAWHAGVSKINLGDGVLRSNLNNCLIGIEIVNPGVLEREEDGAFTYNCGGKLDTWKNKDEVVKSSITYLDGTVLEGYSVPYPDKQIRKLVALCQALVAKYPNITRDSIVTHYEIARPAGRKNDPFGLDVEMIKDLIFDT